MNRIECDQFGKSVSKCNICDNIFDTKKQINWAYENRTLNQKWKCNKISTSIIKLSDHTKTVYGTKNQCDMCSKIFTSITKLNQHTKTLHGPNNQCNMCSKIFTSNNGVRIVTFFKETLKSWGICWYI